ncbi:hypothetical protein [Pseudomonas sp.]|uniref:hypothetical protein n=1 Tax=Pseudomonas sp. TaxID=306 RepID=UPI002735A07C|nr:hypothetical protein [Pseudomonas sp.]MDP2748045.1 hypothetical protein [Pseudomonas sp.]
MNVVIGNFKWLMLVSGVLTASMFYGLFAPQAALESMFGVSFTGQLESIVIRSWSALVGLMGVILIYGALNEKYRAFCATIAATSKAIFITLVLVYGQAFLGKAAAAIIMDILVIAATLIFLLALRIKR